MGFAKIIALDLGKFKTVACVMDVASRTHAFETVEMSLNVDLLCSTSTPAIGATGGRCMNGAAGSQRTGTRSTTSPSRRMSSRRDRTSSTCNVTRGSPLLFQAVVKSILVATYDTISDQIRDTLGSACRV